jgi:hypothetical protein
VICHFESDDAATNHEHSLRQLLELQRTRRIDNTGIVGRIRQLHGFRSRGDDALLEADNFRALITDYLELVRRNESTRPANDPDFALLDEPVEPAHQLAHNLILPFAQLVGVDVRLTEGNAVRSHFPGLFDDSRCV